MTPAPRNFKIPVQAVVPLVQNENNNIEDDDRKRVPLTANARKYFKERPCVLLSELNVNKDKEVKKPLVHGMKVMLPISKQAIVNGILPHHIIKKKRPPKDVRDDESQKSCFLSALNLVGKREAETKEQSINNQPLDSSLEKKLRSRKGQVVIFYRNNPLPITSHLGRKILEAGLGKCQNKKDEINRYEKYCSSRMRYGGPQTGFKWNVVNTRKSKLKKDQHCHIYSFGALERKKRNIELTIGLSEKSFPLFNQCRDLSIRVQRMTDKDVADEMQRLQTLSSSHGKQQDENESNIPWENKVPPVRWISSEPIAGPSRAVEKIAQPIVKLYDIRLSPSKSKYFT